MFFDRYSRMEVDAGFAKDELQELLNAPQHDKWTAETVAFVQSFTDIRAEILIAEYLAYLGRQAEVQKTFEALKTYTGFDPRAEGEMIPYERIPLPRIN